MIDAETTLQLVSLLMMLALAVFALRGHLDWKRWWTAREDKARRERERREYGGPWGGG